MTKRPSVLLVSLCLLTLFALMGAVFGLSLAAEVKGGQRKGPQLIVKNIVPGQEITDHDWGFVKLEIGVESDRALDIGKKKRSRRNPLKIKLDNKEVGCWVTGSRTGYEGKKAYTYKTVALPFGSQRGPRTIGIVYNRLSRNIPVIYNPRGQIVISGLFDDQAIFGKKDPEINWVGFYLSKGSIKASINGKDVSSEIVPSRDEAGGELLDGRIKPGDKLRVGANKLRIDANDIQGGKCVKEIVFHYYPDNRIRVGDTFVLSLGVEESRNGPFYDAVVLGKSIVKKGDFGLPPEPERMGGHIVIPTGQNMFARFMATAPGDGSITIREKQGRTDTPHEIEKIALKVFGTASIGALQELGGNALQLYSAGDYFTCATPSNWYRITDPAGNRKIFGVSAYETGQDDRLSVKMSIEFYPPDNALGYRTADEFIRSQLRKGALRAKSGMPDNVFETTVAGRKARTFERDIFIVGKTATLFFSKKVPLVERFIVVPATAGFYVLEFRTPLNDFAKNDQLFNAIINSFVPLR